MKRSSDSSHRRDPASIFFSLVEDIWCYIVQEMLTIDDLQALDTSLHNRQLRSSFKQALYNRNLVIRSTSFNNNLKNYMLGYFTVTFEKCHRILDEHVNWAFERGLALDVYSFFLSAKEDRKLDKAIEYIASSDNWTRTTRGMCFGSILGHFLCQTPIPLTRFPHLTILHIEDCIITDPADVHTLANAFPLLHTITLYYLSMRNFDTTAKETLLLAFLTARFQNLEVFQWEERQEDHQKDIRMYSRNDTDNMLHLSHISMKCTKLLAANQGKKYLPKLTTLKLPMLDMIYALHLCPIPKIAEINYDILRKSCDDYLDSFNSVLLSPIEFNHLLGKLHIQALEPYINNFTHLSLIWDKMMTSNIFFAFFFPEQQQQQQSTSSPLAPPPIMPLLTSFQLTCNAIYIQSHYSLCMFVNLTILQISGRDGLGINISLQFIARLVVDCQLLESLSLDYLTIVNEEENGKKTAIDTTKEDCSQLDYRKASLSFFALLAQLPFFHTLRLMLVGNLLDNEHQVEQFHSDFLSLLRLKTFFLRSFQAISLKTFNTILSLPNVARLTILNDKGTWDETLIEQSQLKYHMHRFISLKLDIWDDMKEETLLQLLQQCSFSPSTSRLVKMELTIQMFERPIRNSISQCSSAVNTARRMKQCKLIAIAPTIVYTRSWY